MNEKETAKARRAQMKKLLDASTPAERRRIKKARCEGRKLRKQLEALGQNE